MARSVLGSNSLLLPSIVVGVVGLAVVVALAYAYFQGIWPFERRP